MTLVASATDVFDRLKRRSVPLAQDPDGHTVKGWAFQHRTNPFRIERRGSPLGEHTQKILAELRNLNAADHG